MSISDALNELAIRQGKDPIDPRIVREEYHEGPIDPPPAVEYGDPHEDYTEPAPRATMVTMRPPQPVVSQEPPAPVLLVLDQDATFRGQRVSLSPQEFAAIGTIVLRAVQRRVKAQQEELLKSLPKRVRVRRTASEEVAATRRRGRPKKEAPPA